MNTAKKAQTDHPVHELVARRYSPYGFADREIADDDLRSLFEAARWAPSSYNEQPWGYLVAKRSDAEAFKQLLSCLVEANQAWARNASAIVLCVARKTFTKNGKPNRAAEHDVGLASATLSFEATARGIAVHQMIGILPDRAREVFDVPADAEVLTALAIGYAADPDTLDEPMKTRDTNPRRRKSLSELVFSGRWGEVAPFVRS